MKKTKPQPKTNQEKSQKRREVMNEIAVKVTKDPSMTWRRFETTLKRAYEDGNKIVVTVMPL